MVRALSAAHCLPTPKHTAPKHPHPHTPTSTNTPHPAAKHAHTCFMYSKWFTASAHLRAHTPPHTKAPAYLLHVLEVVHRLHLLRELLVLPLLLQAHLLQQRAVGGGPGC